MHFFFWFRDRRSNVLLTAQELEQRCRRYSLAVIFVHWTLLVYSSWIHSPVDMEANVLSAGYIHLIYGRYDIAQVNPPLSRIICALPSLLYPTSLNWTEELDAAGLRPEYSLGEKFLTEKGSSVRKLLLICRTIASLFSVIAAIVIFSITRHAYGAKAGLAAVVMWCLCPMVLGHAATVVHDVPGAAMLILTFPFFQWFRERDGLASSIWFGVFSGLAILTRTTAIPVIGLWLLFHVSDWKKWQQRSTVLIQTIRIFTVLTTSWFILNAGYEFSGMMVPLEDYQFFSQALTGTDHGSENRFRTSLLKRCPVPLPMDFVHGIDLQQRDFESPPFPSYLYGEWRSHGWWYYYLFAWCVKTPTGFQLMFLISFVRVSWDIYRRKATSFDAIILGSMILIFALTSTKSGFTIHYRYVFPAFPFMTILASRFWKDEPYHPMFSVAGMVLIAYGVISSLSVFPHSLSYFNEIAGGPKNGPRLLLHSSCDWGQDMYLLEHWYHQRRETEEAVFIRYLGSIKPDVLGLPRNAIPIRKHPLFRRSEGEAEIRPGWYVVSVSALYDQSGNIRYLDRMLPQDSVGYTIRVYNLKSHDIERLRLNHSADQ